jgi:hypothetical protein
LPQRPDCQSCRRLPRRLTQAEWQQYNLGLLCGFLGDPPFEEIKLEDLQRFMAYLQTTYPPKRPRDVEGKLSLSAVDNYWKAIRSFGYRKLTISLPIQTDRTMIK